MPKYVAAGTGYEYNLEFKVNGEFVSPASAVITITNNSGDIIGSFDEFSLTIPAGATSVQVTTTAGNNTATLSYEFRYIEVEFVYNSKTYTLSDFYILRDNIRFPLTPSQVKAAVGMGDADIPDDLVDILNAYGMVQDDAEGTDLDTILSGGTVLLPFLIDAVKYRAALEILISAENSSAQMEQADNTIYSRFSKVDFASIRSATLDSYKRALRKLTGVTTPTAPTLVLTATGTDAVTGE